ncbi:hypothetical protein [Methanobacterium sp.]|uniref:hypothetical protein n=1 Tax=Methanobacterium sp. TaxID=2164 RepID=UPI003C758C4E
MSESLLTLKITSQNGNIRVVSKLDGEVSVKTILLKLILGYCWWANIPAVETVFNLIEEAIRSTIKNVYDYDDLVIDYDYKANDLLEDASTIEVFINSVIVDEVEIEVTGRYISFEGEDNRGSWKKFTSFRRKVDGSVHKNL